MTAEDMKFKRLTDICWREKVFGYIVGPSGVMIINGVIGSYLNMYYTDVLFISGTLMVALPILCRLLNAITNVIMGLVIDKTKSKWGKARPYILYCAIPFAISVILLFGVPNLSKKAMEIWVIITYNLYYCVVLTMYNSSHGLMVPLSTRNNTDRIQLSVLTNISTNVIAGTVVAAIMPFVVSGFLGYDKSKWIFFMAILSAISVPLTFAEFLYTKERITEENAVVKEVNVPIKLQIKAMVTNKYWVMLMIYSLLTMTIGVIQNLALVYYARDVLGSINHMATVSIIGGLPMGIGALIVWPLCKKFGKRNLTVIGFVFMVTGGVIAMVNPHNLVWVLAGLFIKNIGTIPSAYVMPAFFADVNEHIEWRQHFRVDGLSSSVLNTMNSVGTGIGTALLNVILLKSGYEAVISATGGIQSQSAQMGIIIAFLGIGIFINLIQGIIIVFFDIENKMYNISNEIKLRNKNKLG
ncbi:MFS transporter [Clostridium diolis]|uniref:MFS transporter n=1 Tax=Clostridium diolis TaxID=223919 RepID=UPI003AF6A8BB